MYLVYRSLITYSTPGTLCIFSPWRSFSRDNPYTGLAGPFDTDIPLMIFPD